MKETRQKAALRVAVAPIHGVEVRNASGTGDGSWTIEGYAAVYDQATTLWDGRWFRFDEQIARGAFTNVLSRVASGDELVHLNYVHEMSSAIAATNVDQGADEALPIGGLRLAEDDHGLYFFARVDPDDPDAQRMAVKMKRGVVTQASFAFTIADEQIVETGERDGKEYDLWQIDEIGHLYDVCACPQGAYAQTEVGIRNLAGASLALAFGHGFDRALSVTLGGGAEPVTQQAGGDDDRERQELALRASTIKASRKGSI